MSEKKTTEKFKQEVFNMYKNEYEVIGEYVNSHTKIKIKHIKCNNEWDVKPYSFLSGRKCPKCARIIITDFKKRTHEQFKKEVFDLTNNEYTIIGQYINALTKIVMRHNCNKCNNNEWSITPNDFINNGSRCPICAGNRLKTTEQFKKDIFKLVQNEYTVLGKYTGDKNNIRMIHNCLKCNNNEYDVSPHNFLAGNRCPKCKEVKGEKYIREFLQKYNIQFKPQKKFKELIGLGNGLLSYDFYLPDYNLLIEYQGKFHDGTAKRQTKEGFTKQQEHDKRKREYAKNNNINLLEIWYYDFNNIENILANEFNMLNL